MSKKKTATILSQANKQVSTPPASLLVSRHLRFGWWSLLVFVSLGIFLEGLHAFKVAWYLDVGMETRRLMWRLGHAHGTFLSLVHIAYAATLYIRPDPYWGRSFASASLMGAGIAVPSGFFLGGVVIYGGDPGLGILLLPVGALLLLLTIVLTALAVSRSSRE